MRNIHSVGMAIPSRPASMPPAEPLQAVIEMTETLKEVPFWKLKEQMVAANVPGALRADWAEDLIVLAVEHNFTFDFRRRPAGLSRPKPNQAGGGAAVAYLLPPPPANPIAGGGAAVASQGSSRYTADMLPPTPAISIGVIPSVPLPLNGPPTPAVLPVRVVIQAESNSVAPAAGLTCVADSLAKLYEAEWTQDFHADFQRGFIFPGTHTAQEIQVVIKEMGHKSS